MNHIIPPQSWTNLMSTSTIDSKTLESYLFADDKSEFLQKLVPGTETHSFLSFLHAINTSDRLSPGLYAKIKEYSIKFKTNLSQNIHIRALLKKFDDPSLNQEDKSEVLNSLLTKYLPLDFNYTKPADIKTSNLNRSQANHPSKLDEKTVSFDPEDPALYKNIHAFSDLTPQSYSRLNTKKLLQADVQVLEKFVMNANPIDFEDFCELIVTLMKKKNTQINYIYPVLARLSLEQLVELKRLNPDFSQVSEFLRAVCKREFRVSSTEEIGKDLPKKEKREALYKLYVWTGQQQHAKTGDLAASALYQILQLDLELNNFDKGLFIEYLKNPRSPYNHIAELHDKKLKSDKSRRGEFAFESDRITQDELIKVYLEEFSKDEKYMENFQGYIKSNYLREILYSAKLLSGQVLGDSNEVLDHSKLKSLGESKDLTICKYNKEYYKHDDIVKLSVTLKNIPSLMIKIFEFRPENYYLKEKKQLDGSINLDGLIASEELNLDFTEPPIVRFTKEFTLESISQKKQGIFIIDFIGNGLSSRAVIRKGKLSYIEHQTVAGQLFYIVDEDANVCKGNGTGVWLKGRLYKADEQGRILVPFSEARTEKAVLVHEGFAELTDIHLKAESYEFKCAYLYNHESFLMGNRAKVLIQPRLFLNNQPIGLDVIQECNVTVTLLNSDTIRSTLNFDKLKVSAYEETEIEFTVPGKLIRACIAVKAKIRHINKKEPQEYDSMHNIGIDRHADSNVFCHLYLRYSTNGYEILALGKNGEPKQGINLTLGFQNRYKATEIKKTLQTDSNGKIYLGKLKEITSVQATSQAMMDISSVKKKWNIDSQRSVSYPSTIRICQGDYITLPLLHSELNRHRISFCEVLSSGEVLRNCLSALKVDRNKLVISDLPEGRYSLHLKDVQARVYINVIKGTYWSENGNFLNTGETLINVKNDVNNIAITDFEITKKEGSEDLADIKISVAADQAKLARFHIFGAQFMEPDMNRSVRSMNANVSTEPHKEVYLGLRQSQFLNNRALGDEYCYVLDRKSQARFLGNTLEKPQVLLKKTFVRETQTQDEQLTANQEFKGDKMKDKDRSTVEKMMMDMRDKQGYMVNSAEGVDSFLNFLGNACLVSSNLKIDEEGAITVTDFPYKKYSHIQVIASNLACNVSEVFPLDCEKIETKDLTQKHRGTDAVFSMKRVSNKVLKGEKICIEDLASTQVQIIDDFSKLFDILKSFRDNDWDFLKDWEDLENEEKLRLYDKYASHELNLFVYLRDHKFYEQVVLPFLHNKIEKTMIDYFLLKNEKKMLEYAEPEKFNSLNSLEKILVIMAVRECDPAQAKALVRLLEDRQSLENVDYGIYDKYFDSVLEAKTAEQNKQETNERLQTKNQLKKKMKMEQKESEKACKQERSSEKKERKDHKAKELTTMFFGGVGNSAPSRQGRGGSRSGRGRGGSRGGLGGQHDFSNTAEEYDEFGGEEYMEARQRVLAGFQELEKTKEYQERHYYGKQGSGLIILLNMFWVDLAKHIVENGGLDKKPFLTKNFIYAHSNLTEMIAALSFIALPFSASKHTSVPHKGLGIELEAGSDLIVFTKAVTQSDLNINEDILIRQRFFDPQNRFTDSKEDPGTKVAREIDQYIINKVYGCSVVVTNSSSSDQLFQVLVEIPEGSIPLASTDYAKSQNMQLNAYSTQTIEFQFYFPKAGHFKVNPSSVSKRGKVVAVSKHLEIQVQTEQAYTNLETLNAVLAQGSKADVLEFARTKNLCNPSVFDFNSIYWLLKADKEFFLDFIRVLRERKYFDVKTWQFGVFHNDIQTIKEYLGSVKSGALLDTIQYLDSSVLKIDKLHLLEYNPFVNQRVHLLSEDKNRILNVQLKEQYNKFLAYLCERNIYDASHYLGLVYYLLLQDRIQDALKFFGKIDREEVRKNHEFELQYDYFAAYIDFYVGYPKLVVAREICKKYLDYPVLSWRSFFIEIANQLAEFDGQGKFEDDRESEKDKKKQNFANAEKEETITMEIDQSRLLIVHQNVKNITISLYRVDLEVLFSRNPFIEKSKDEFSFIKPTKTEKIDIESPHELGKLNYEIPKDLSKYNLHIEVKVDNKTLYGTYFSTSIKAMVVESYGQVKVIDTDNTALSMVYVKCFAKGKDGKVSFYKDGYTDLRGRFDYATLNSSDISNIEKFAIFVMSDELGALIKEARAPNKLGRIEDRAF